MKKKKEKLSFDRIWGKINAFENWGKCGKGGLRDKKDSTLCLCLCVDSEWDGSGKESELLSVIHDLIM